MSRKYELGQVVHLQHDSHTSATGLFEVVRLLPEEKGEFWYRIKSGHENHERAVREGQLSPVAGTV